MKKKTLLLPAIKLLLLAHTFIGKVIDVLAIKANNEIHPKHALMRYYHFFVENIHQEDSVLDIGCGNGFVAAQISRKARRVVGIDTSEENIRLAKKLHHAGNTRFVLGDATTYSFKEKYNAIILSNVLEHIYDRPSFLQKIQKLSDTFLIRVPMIDRDWLPLYKKELGIFYFCDSTHFTEYTLESFQKEMTEAQLAVVSYTIRFGEIWAVVKKL